MIRNSRTGYFASSPFIYLIFSWKIWFQTWKWKQNIWWRERSRIDEFLLRNILVLHSQKITKNAVLLAFGVKLAPNIFLSELTSQTPKNKWEVLKKKKKKKHWLYQHPLQFSVFKHFFKVRYKLLDNGIHSCGKGMGSGFLLPSFLWAVPVAVLSNSVVTPNPT